MMQGELQAAALEREETEAAPPPSIAELEALLDEERRQADSEIFALHRQIAELTNQTRELERLQKSAPEASERAARLEEELAAQLELSTALSELRRWQAELSKRRDDALAPLAVAREVLEKYRIRITARRLVALEDSAAYRFGRALADAV